MLTVPDLTLQFIVEVNASDVGIGAVLSQRSPLDNKLHPCDFLSRKLTPAERNYDVGNRELLAVKVALEEWRHWLEGAEQLFLVLIDHCNLEYLHSAKCLNARQARWALFFNRFNFHLSYRPKVKNMKPDALSQVRSPDPKLGIVGIHPAPYLQFRSSLFGGGGAHSASPGVPAVSRQLSTQLPVRLPEDENSSSSMGSCLSTLLSPWGSENSFPSVTEVLVAFHEG